MGAKIKVRFYDNSKQTQGDVPSVKKIKVKFHNVNAKPASTKVFFGSSYFPTKFQNKKDFAKTFVYLYKNALAQQGFPEEYAYYLAAQAALESDWGTKPAGWKENVVTNNYIGEKDLSKQLGHTMTTTEYINGVPKKIKDSFRKFDSIEDMVEFHVWKFSRGHWVSYNIYDQDDVSGFGKKVSNAGYATDPTYAIKLDNTVKSVKELLNQN